MSRSADHLLPFVVLAQIFGIWVVSDIGYYTLLSLLGKGAGYSSDPLVMSLYYLFWVGVTLVTFKSLYKRWRMLRVNTALVTMVLVTATIITLYLVYIFPSYAPIQWNPSWQPPPEIFTASRWYFLPKSIEIILQQLLVLAMVLAYYERRYTLRETSNRSAALFGSIHLLLVFGQSFAYMLVFTLCATAAGFVFPYLMLRWRNGFVSAFLLHWTFYAAIIVLIRVLYVR